VGVLVVKNGIVVQSINFRKYLPVGIPSVAVEYLDNWGIDEIVLLDIDATGELRRPRYDRIMEYSRHCHVPLAVGGGITDVLDIERLVHSGADKVVINTAAIENPSLITRGAKLFGNQCIVASIDACRLENGRYKVFTHSGRQPAGYGLTELAKIVEEHGAGEILLTSIDRDGSKQGYDLEMLRQVVNSVKIPVIICGGVGCPKHFCEAMDLNVSAAAAANFFHYTEHSAIIAKNFIRSAGFDVRLGTYTTYQDFGFDADGRVTKIDDLILEKLRFEYIPEETI
jgi:cyclase